MSTAPDPTTADPLDRFQALFTLLRPDVPMPLDQVYAPEIVFVDPLHRVEGLPALQRYFTRLNAGLQEGRFTFAAPIRDGQSAVLPWTMQLTLRRARRPVVVDGCSHLRFTTHVTYQRDYFDAGALVYENVPLLGFVVRRIKAALA